MRWIRGFLDNNSVFGRLMTRCGILIAGNLLLILFSLPLFTAGAAWTALYDTLFRTLLGDGELNPFRAFWRAFRNNFRQATAAWLLLLALAVFLLLELFWCGQFTGPVSLFRYGLLALLLAEAVLSAYLFPVMAAFRGSLRELLGDCVYFIVRRPLTLVVILFAHAAPVLITYWDIQRLPLYAFLWCITGFSGIAMCCGNLLLKQFRPLLRRDAGEEAADGAGDATEPSERRILEDMRKLGM